MDVWSKEVVLGWLRHGASALGPLLVAFGFFDAEDWGSVVSMAEDVVGVALTAWAFYASWKAKQIAAAAA